MASLNPFKLERLQILAFQNQHRFGLPTNSFTVMFNPSSYEMSHENVFQNRQGINTTGRANRYSHSRSGRLSLDLVFDGMGVSDLGLISLVGMIPLIGKGTPSVSQRIETFLAACFRMDGKVHAPKYLTLNWGDGPLKGFECRMDTVSIEFTAFDRNGAPLRAKLKTSFVEDISPSKRLALEEKSSPDLTHHRVVRRGDTLPMLCREIYGRPDPYLFVANANGLDEFRQLEPGRQLVFPPLPATASKPRAVS